MQLIGFSPQIKSVALHSLLTHYDPQILSADGLGKGFFLMSKEVSQKNPDPRPAYVSSIDISQSRIRTSDSQIVLMCGGLAKIVKEDGGPQEILSLRHALLLNDSSFEQFRPEEITEWNHYGTYDNLIEFELDLAAICNLIVIILESEGSIAELGAFSQVEEIRQKLIVILSSEYSEKDSFISLGILRLLKKHNPARVKSYPWQITEPPISIDPSLVSDILSDISGDLNKEKKNPTLDVEQRSHRYIVLLHFIEFFSALKLTEIKGFMEIVGVPISVVALKRILFLFERFEIVARIEYSDSTFYALDKNVFHRLEPSFKKGHQNDSVRAKASCNAYYAASDDSTNRHRVRALKNFFNRKYGDE